VGDRLPQRQIRAGVERLLDEWRPDLVEIHLQAMAQYVDAPRSVGSVRPRRLRPTQLGG
jgi:hypothetical protein